MMQSIYLDNNATTYLDPRVADCMHRYALEQYANPASQHFAGRKARRVLEAARDKILHVLGAQTQSLNADQLVFTSGGTEANNLALLGLAGRAGRIVISAIEHPSVTAAAQHLASKGYEISILPVDSRGVVQIDQLPSLLTEKTRLVSVMLGNNETGVLQPIREIADLCRRHGVLCHTDAVQGVGKIPVNFRELNVDALSFTAHKFHGPIGIGALIVRKDAKLDPVLYGGFQQGGVRPGTESVMFVMGMLSALELWTKEAGLRMERMKRLRDKLEALLRAGCPDMIVHGELAPRLPHTSSVAFPGVERQSLLMALDMAQVACSAGSACASGSSEPSPVLLAMGLPTEVVKGSIRLSLSAFTSDSEVDEAAQRILRCLNNLRRNTTARVLPSPPRVESAKSL